MLLLPSRPTYGSPTPRGISRLDAAHGCVRFTLAASVDTTDLYRTPLINVLCTIALTLSCTIAFLYRTSYSS